MDTEDIKQRMRERGVRQIDLANALGLLPNKVSLSLTGKRRFTVREMDIVRQLLTAEAVELPPPLPMIPVIGQVAASGWQSAVQKSSLSMPSPDPELSSRAFGLDVEGDSMDLFVQDGGRVIVDPDDKSLFPRRFYVVLNDYNETTFKRFFADPARLEPCSTNPAHKVIFFGGGETFTVVGRVVWFASRTPD